MNPVLWIPSWYPSRVDFLSGDFIERHAKAAAASVSVQVIFVVKDPKLKYGIIETEEKLYAEKSSACIYYYGTGNFKGFIEAMLSFIFQFKIFLKAYKKYFYKYGKPSAFHLHVAIKYSWIAWWWSVSKKIPLIISEHWTGYLREAKQEWNALSFLQRFFMKKAFAKAILLITVSEYLAKNIALKFKKIPPHIFIPNVVDTSIFKPANSIPKNDSQFIHISTLSHQKNFDEIIEACSLVKKSGYHFRLIIYGSCGKKYHQKIKEINLLNEIIFKDEVPQTALANDLATSKALILYSLYETFGCVIIEANACGVPCIVSKILAFNENVTVENGIKIPLHKPDLLSNCMIQFINNEIEFDIQKIITFTNQKYSFKTVGNLFADAYKTISSV
ncbi:MAG: glycosyltransferase family 4 protein [Chitinophagaceae bacterium]